MFEFRYTNYHEDILKHNDALQTAILKSRRLPDNIRETREIEHVNEEYHRLANQSQQRIDELKAKVNFTITSTSLPNKYRIFRLLRRALLLYKIIHCLVLYSKAYILLGLYKSRKKGGFKRYTRKILLLVDNNRIHLFQVKVHQDYFEGMQTAEKWLLNKSSQIMSASSQVLLFYPVNYLALPL